MVIKSTLIANGERFVDSPDPKVLLGMPGCIPIAINPAHDLLFQSSSTLRRIHTVEQYAELVQALPQSDRPDIFDLQCYCARVGVDAIIALEPDDCVFDRTFKRLQELEVSRLRDGIEFHQQPGKTGRRTYRISRIYGRLPGYEIDSENLCVMEVRVIPIPNLTLSVESVRANGVPPEELKACVWLGDVCLLDELQFSIQSVQHESYVIAHNKLNRIIAKMKSDASLSTAREIFDEAPVPSDVKYSQYADFVTALFVGIQDNENDRAEFLDRCIDAKNRLWDATIARDLESRILQLLSSEGVAEQIVNQFRVDSAAYPDMNVERCGRTLFEAAAMEGQEAIEASGRQRRYRELFEALDTSLRHDKTSEYEDWDKLRVGVSDS